MNLVLAKDYDEMSSIAAKEIAKLIFIKPNCVLGLATGSTPIGMYKKLVEYYKDSKVDFSKVTTFNLDEYKGLNGEHDQSYRYFMNNNLFYHINIDLSHTFMLNGMAKDIDLECKNFDKKIEEYGGIDLQILGIGKDGHIGFNEPSDALNVGTHLTNLKEQTIKDNSRFFKSIKEVPTQALTMGMGNIMKARKIILLASGANKADIIKKLVEGNISTNVPASLLKVHNDTTVIVDNDAASLLKKRI